MSLSHIGKMSIAAGAMIVAGLLGSSAPAAAAGHGHHGGYHRGGGGGHFAARGFYRPRPVYQRGYRYRRPFYGVAPIYPAYGARRCFIRRAWVQTYYGPQLVRRRICRW